MRRNYAARAAWLLLIIEFAVPFAVDLMFHDWVRKQGPGGPYLAAFWLTALSLIGGVTAVLAVVLSYRGFSGRLTSLLALGIHLLVGALPVIAVIRLIFGLY